MGHLSVAQLQKATERKWKLHDRNYWERDARIPWCARDDNNDNKKQTFPSVEQTPKAINERHCIRSNTRQNPTVETLCDTITKRLRRSHPVDKCLVPSLRHWRKQGRQKNRRNEWMDRVNDSKISFSNQ